MYLIRPWNLLNVKKTSSLIKVISSYNICSGIKSQQVEKPLVIQYQKYFFSEFLCSISSSHFWPLNFLCAFNWETKWKLQKLKNILKEIAYPPKKAFKKKIKYYTGKDKCPSFTNFFRMPKINNSNLSKEKQKELKMLAEFCSETPRCWPEKRSYQSLGSKHMNDWNKR